jgi:hypothetical protein
MKTKQTKQQEAIARQKEYNSLTLTEKAKRIAAAPGKSIRQWTRLQKELENK